MKRTSIAMILLVSGTAAMAIEPSTGFDGARQRVADLERQIAERLALLNLADPLATESIRAAVHYRVAARTLLSKGADAGDDGALAMLYGHKLFNRMAEADRFFETYPAMARTAQDRSNPDATVAAQRFVRAIKRFNTVGADRADELPDVNAAAVDRFLSKLFAPLAPACGHKALISTWQRGDTPATERGVAFDAAAVDQLKVRIERVEPPALIRSELLSAADHLRMQWIARKADANAARRFAAQHAALDAAEQVRRAAWAGAATTERLERQLHMAVLLTKDPRTRPVGVGRIDRIRDTASLLAALEAVDRTGTPTEDVAALLLNAHDTLVAGHDDDNAPALMAQVENLIDGMTLYRRMLTIKLPAGLGRPARALRIAYQRQELLMLGILANRSNNQERLTGADRPAESLLAAARRIERVYRLPEWAGRLGAFEPKIAGSLMRRLTEQANGLTKADTAAEAETRLTALQKNLADYDPIPGETLLATGGERVAKLTDGQHQLLGVQIRRLRQDWTHAWARSKPTDSITERLGLMRRLVALIQSNQARTDLPAITRRLSTWAGWDTPALDPAWLDEDADALMAKVSRSAAIGDWARVGATLDDIERRAAILRAITRLHSRWAKTKAPGGIDGLIAQVVHAPTTSSVATAARQQSAHLAVRLTEMARAQGLNDATTATRHRAAALASALAFLKSTADAP